MTFTFTVHGPAHGKGRPRFDGRTKRTYTPRSTEKAEDRVRWAWRDAGSPRLDGPIVLALEVITTRPKKHFRVNGDLSAIGERTPWPIRKPDLSNILKTFEDALNAHAYADDQQLVQVHVVRRWAHPGEDEHTVVTLTGAQQSGAVQAVTSLVGAAA